MSKTPVMALHPATAPPSPLAASAPGGGIRTFAGDYSLREHDGGRRASVERFIARRFAESFGARVETFMPRLLSLRDGNGTLCGASGLRCASRRLFIERYLDEPIEAAIARHAGIAAERASVVEVGHLCGTFPGAMRTLIALLAPRLQREGFAWVAFAGTRRLRNAFARIGMHPVDIAAANADRLTREERPGWGSYYDHGPRILVGRIEDGTRTLGSCAATHSIFRQAAR